MKYANIIVDISHEKLDKPFVYGIPEELTEEITAGSRVEVPFGKGNRRISGYVIDITEQADFEPERIKYIYGIRKGSLKIESQLIALAWWMKEQYGSTMNQALKTVIPIKKSVKEVQKQYISLHTDRETAKNYLAEYRTKKNTAARARLLEELLEQEVLEQSVIQEKLGVSRSVIRALQEKQLIDIRSDVVFRNPVHMKEQPEYDIVLNQEQRTAVEEILNHRDRTHLIFGITGSGKTEVYMELIQNAIENGKETILLIPEIALTYQTMKRFYRRFGNQISIINSRLSAGERYDQFERAKRGEIKVMIGPRSALFTPFRNLGFIIIDEEQEGAYKSEQIPRYHARETAIRRGELSGATVVLGSATPSVQSFYRAECGEYMLHRLTKRANHLYLPKAEVVDMRKELEEGNREVFSRRLLELISDRLEKKEQVMLFINRRGYSGFVSCRTCGTPVKCPHCDVSLTHHKYSYGRKETLVCHYCGYSMDMPKVCPKCASKYLGRFGIGTEQVETRMKELFPQAAVLRMDFDTTREKDGHEKILETFATRNADILVGTQMIVKGHDFPYVTLVGVLAADLSLFAADFLAGERTFQLLTQAAGRAGRGKYPGEAVFQTYNPEDACIRAALQQDYESFYRNEISYRSLMAYPPVYFMAAILISDKNEMLAEQASADFAGRIEKSRIDGLMVIGPSKAGLSKLNDIYRYVIYLKHQENDVLIQVKNRLQVYLNRAEKYRSLSVQFDFNPMNGY